MAIQDLCWWGFYWLHGVGFWVDLCICIWLPAMSLYWYRGFVSGLVNCLLWLCICFWADLVSQL